MKSFISRPPWLQVTCLLHALLVTGVWIMVFKFDLDVMPGKLWMAFALLWILWLSALIFSQKEDRLRWIIGIAIGFLVLVPTISTLYTFIVCTVEGFSP